MKSNKFITYRYPAEPLRNILLTFSLHFRNFCHFSVETGLQVWGKCETENIVYFTTFDFTGDDNHCSDGWFATAGNRAFGKYDPDIMRFNFKCQGRNCNWCINPVNCSLAGTTAGTAGTNGAVHHFGKQPVGAYFRYLPDRTQSLENQFICNRFDIPCLQLADQVSGTLEWCCLVCPAHFWQAIFTPIDFYDEHAAIHHRVYRGIDGTVRTETAEAFWGEFLIFSHLMFEPKKNLKFWLVFNMLEARLSELNWSQVRQKK